MCSKMQFRPGGMDFSDSELEDDDYVSCQLDVRPIKQNNKPSQNNETQANISRYDQCVPTYNPYDEEAELQCRTLINACQTGQLKVIEDYLKTHNINDFLNTGWTPLMYAASCGQVGVIKYLLERGADPNIHRDGYTPLLALCNSMSSSKDTDLECLLLLIKAGANANATSKQRETSLMYACKTKEPAFVLELMKHVDDINMYDGSNKTALMYAVVVNRPEIVQLLLDNGADQTLCDNNNLCAIDIAKHKQFKKIIEVLDPNKEATLDSCNNSYSEQTWKDFFPTLSHKDKETNDFDVSVMLWGMGLEKYTTGFKGIDLKTFLRLTEEDLSTAGVDISAHRKQFTDCLHSFYRREWLARSTGTIKENLPYTIYDGVITLGAITRHTVIIDSSVVYIKQSLRKAYQENPDLKMEEIIQCLLQLEEMKRSSDNIRKNLLKMKALAKKINQESSIGIPPCHIGPTKNKPKWCLILSFVIILGMTLSKTSYVQRLWSNLDWKIVGSF